MALKLLQHEYLPVRRGASQRTFAAHHCRASGRSEAQVYGHLKLNNTAFFYILHHIILFQFFEFER